ncbi:MAG TPA: SPFH domain-containing protein [Thermomicrobiales bacterium]|nr:SPFH domain-containing protein [Thermomicrobiales bacterium]
MDFSSVLFVVIGLIVVVVAAFAIVASMFRKVGPNQALIVYGVGGTKVVKGGGAVVWPLIQSARELSLELMSFDVAPTQDLYTSQGVAVKVEAVTQIKVKSDPVSILTASEQFLNKEPRDRENLIRLVMEGHLRGIVGQLTVEQIVKEPEMVADRMRSNVAADMSKMGLEVISFTIREVRDNNEYILNMGRPDVASIRRAADIATAEADRDTAIKRAQAMREAKIAEAAAEQEKVIAETASQTRQAEAVRDLNLKRAEFDASVHAQQAATDKAYEIQAAVQQQKITEEQVRVEQVRKHGEIAVQEAEIQRREKELIATVLRAAEIERQRIETLAEAERQRQVLEATGRAEATRMQGQADADVTNVRGMAEAAILRAKGEAEATAMHVKAAAYLDYNQAAVLDRIVAALPEIVAALAQPLNNVDKITVVSTGGDSDAGAGVNRVTADIARMVAQAPAIVEGLTGVDVGQMLQQLPAVRRAQANGVAPGADAAAVAPEPDGRTVAEER